MQRAPSTGGEVNTTIVGGSTLSPLDVAFDETAGKMYMVYGTGTVTRSDFDGTNLETLITPASTSNGTSAGIALDATVGLMFLEVAADDGVPPLPF